jgi:hypothetical protein
MFQEIKACQIDLGTGKHKTRREPNKVWQLRSKPPVSIDNPDLIHS